MEGGGIALRGWERIAENSRNTTDDENRIYQVKYEKKVTRQDSAQKRRT